MSRNASPKESSFRGSVAWHPERRLRMRLLEQHISVYFLRKWVKFVRWRWRDVSEFIFVYLYHFRHKCVYCNLITVCFFALSQWLLAKQQETNCYNNPLMHSLASPQCHHLRNQWPMRQRSPTVSPCVWAQWFDVRWFDIFFAISWGEFLWY